MATHEHPPTKQDESFSEEQPRIDEPGTDAANSDEPGTVAGEPDAAASGATPAGVPHARPDEDDAGADDELEGKGWTQGGHALK